MLGYFLKINHKHIFAHHFQSIRHRSAAARLTGLRVRNIPEIWKFISCEYCEVSVIPPCDWTIPRPEEPYRLCMCPCVCDKVQH